MKSILISIRPKWCEKIASGEKTVEVRKTKPKLEMPFKVYIYCTYGEGLIEYSDLCFPNMLIGKKVTKDSIWSNCCNGKVIAEFVCDKIIDICIEMSKPDDLPGYPFPCTGLTDKEILQYLGNGKTGYGWHISDLVIYDKPRELYQFNAPGKRGEFYGVAQPIERPPQSWCYVEEVHNGTENRDSL